MWTDGVGNAAFAAPGTAGTARTAPLLAVCAGYFMVILDVTITNVAVPVAGRELSASLTGIQWITDGYSLVFAGFLMTGGALGDRLGNRRVFCWGVVVFTVSSAACAFAPSAPLPGGGPAGLGRPGRRHPVSAEADGGSASDPARGSAVLLLPALLRPGCQRGSRQGVREQGPPSRTPRTLMWTRPKNTRPGSSSGASAPGRPGAGTAAPAPGRAQAMARRSSALFVPAKV